MRYDAIAKLLHWLVAALYFAVLVIGLQFDDMPRGSASFLNWLGLHETLGLALLVLAGWRMARRLRSGFPGEHPAHKPYERAAARVVIWALLLASVALPITGLYETWVAGDALILAGVTLWPMADAPRAGTMLAFALHGGPLIVLGLLPPIVLHAAAALKHHWVDRDDTLRRMLPEG